MPPRALLLFVLPVSVSAAQLSQSDLGSSGALVSACGGLATGAFPIEGGLFDYQAGKHSCTAFTTQTPGQVLNGADAWTQATPVVNTTAQGSAEYGQIGMYAHFRANNSAGFAAAATTAGWTDTWTLTPANPAHVGQNVVLSFGLHLDGVLDGVPSGNSYTRIGVQVWLNDGTAPNGSFRVQGQGQGGFPFHQVINQDLLFSVTVKLGTPFELGLFARASAGVAGAGPNWISEASSDFASTLTWGGIQSVTLGGQAVAYSVSSQSGIDWSQPYAPVPEPGAALLMVLGLGLLGARAPALRASRSGSQGA